ncbi:class II aldolase/adducin family protein [Vulcanisaeta distributa]|uniref:L-fuculose-phosphate aldolase n=1 Tax=Vulcanisaeta distributa (strain DSM 14429 / JCM 11212 / NBRC 100878 / IC-017) TaxID=572478 RepID=E1QP21_VULDI|nr:class II aldolase/adducin family protein [Vulcanisaeta distributa]ADN51386.1 L-fuculose-phosphate aldolase [Vulcanisaeta distributa DSM 14429]
MNEASLRRIIVEIFRLAYARRLVDLLGGNASARLGGDEVLITPTSMPKTLIKPQSIVKIKLDGTIVSGGNPSSEWRMHVGIYRVRDDVKFILHTHPPNILALTRAGLKVDLSFSEAISYVGEIAEVPYLKPGSAELADAVARAVSKKNITAVILRNHGLVTVGSTPYEALNRAEVLENLAYITLLSNCLTR